MLVAVRLCNMSLAMHVRHGAICGAAARGAGGVARRACVPWKPDPSHPRLPGAEPVADPLRVAPVTSPGELLHSLLAVSHAPAPEFLLSVNVAGFLYVSDVDVTRNMVCFPCTPVHLYVFITFLYH